jgi:hypothetical protein
MTVLSSQTETIADGSSATAAAITFQVWNVTGQAASFPEDTGARNCNTSGAATTTPSVIGGSPSQSGDLFFPNGGRQPERAMLRLLLELVGSGLAAMAWEMTAQLA